MTDLFPEIPRQLSDAEVKQGFSDLRAFVDSLEWYDWNRATDQSGEVIVCKWESFR